MITVREHTRRSPDPKPDPFATVMEARRRRFAAKWNIPLVESDDPRLAAPVAEPAQGGRVLETVIANLRALEQRWKNMGATK